MTRGCANRSDLATEISRDLEAVDRARDRPCCGDERRGREQKQCDSDRRRERPRERDADGGANAAFEHRPSGSTRIGAAGELVTNQVCGSHASQGEPSRRCGHAEPLREEGTAEHECARPRRVREELAECPAPCPAATEEPCERTTRACQRCVPGPASDRDADEKRRREGERDECKPPVDLRDDADEGHADDPGRRRPGERVRDDSRPALGLAPRGGCGHARGNQGRDSCPCRDLRCGEESDVGATRSQWNREPVGRCRPREALGVRSEPVSGLPRSRRVRRAVRRGCGAGPPPRWRYRSPRRQHSESARVSGRPPGLRTGRGRARPRETRGSGRATLRAPA